MLSACCSSTSFHHPFPISLNSLDLAGVRLLSPRDSQILPNSCRCRRYQCRWCNRAHVGVRRGPWSLLCFVSGWLLEEPSWDDRGSSTWVYILFIWIWPVTPTMRLYLPRVEARLRGITAWWFCRKKGHLHTIPCNEQEWDKELAYNRHFTQYINIIHTSSKIHT